MPVTMQKTYSEVRPHSLIRALGNRFSAYLEHRRTVRALKACSQRELQDIGIIPHDIVELEHSNPADSIDELSIKSGMRAGNW